MRYGKRVPIFAPVFILLLFSADVLYAAEPSGPDADDGHPRVEFNETEVDLGTSLSHKSVAHAFHFANTGNGPLEVKVAKTSCGCAAAVVSEGGVEPGQIGTVELKYSASMNGLRHGQQLFTAELSTNDPEQPRLIVTMKLELVHVVEVVPSTLDFGILETGDDKVSRSIAVKCLKDKVLPSVKSVATEDPRLVIAWGATEVGEDTASYEYEVSLNTIDGGEYRSVITVHTDSNQIPLIEVPVRANVRFPLVADPPKLLFGLVKPGATVKRSAELRLRDIEGVPARVDCADARMSCSLERLDREAGWRLDAVLSSDASQDDLEKLSIDIEVFDESGSKILELPVFAILGATR
jgi:hypothetical protein